MGGQLVKPYVFISYKSEEYDIANRVRTEMEQSGVPCWMAPESIPGGSSYAEEIPAAIQGCGAFVLILTKKSQNSKWIKRELDIAISKDKLIMPFVPRKINFNNEMSFYLNNVQHFFAYENQDRVLENMINQICDELGIQRQYPQLEKEVSRKSGSVRKKAWIPRLKMKTPLIVLSILAAVLVIGFSIGFSVYFFNTVNICGKRVIKSSLTLELKNSHISARDLENISALMQLRTLHIEHCIFDDTVDNLRGLPASLEKLSLVLCGIDDTHLNSLGGEDCKIIELDISGNFSFQNPLTLNMSNLKNFKADNNCFTNLDFLKNCVSLEKINVAHCMLTDISGIKNISSITELNLNSNKLHTMEGIENSANGIKRLYLEQNKLENIDFLSGMNNLEYLNVAGNSISDLSPMYGKSTLCGFDVSNNEIRELDADKLSHHIRYADFSYNGLERIENTLIFDNNSYGSLNLAGNPNLKEINFNLKVFDVIDLRGCYISNLSSLYARNGITYLLLNYCDELNLTAIHEIVHGKLYLIDCPLHEHDRIREQLNSIDVSFVSAEESDIIEEIQFENLVNKDCFMMVKGRAPALD